VILRAALLVLLLLAPVDPAAAQRGHPLPGRVQRALHVQVMESDALAIGSVEGIATGRIQIGEVNAVEGDLAPHIELKRAPSRPPGLVSGERVVLLLRGARSPYLLVPDADEVLRVADPAAEARMVQALRSLRTALADPAALEARYLAWLTGPDDELRHVAEIALIRPSPPLRAIDKRSIRGLVDLALDPGQPPSARRAAARVAGSDAEGVAALLAALPSDPADDTQALLLLDVLRLGALRASPGTNATLLRALRHEDAAIRRTALELGPTLTRDPSLRAEIERLAREDPAESVRLLAEPLVGAGHAVEPR